MILDGLGVPADAPLVLAIDSIGNIEGTLSDGSQGSEMFGSLSDRRPSPIEMMGFLSSRVTELTVRMDPMDAAA